MSGQPRQWRGAPPPPQTPRGGLGVLPRSPNEQLEPGRAPEPPYRRRQRAERKPRFNGIVNFLGGGLTFLLMGMLTLAAGC